MSNMKGFSPVMFIAAIGCMAIAVLLAGDIAANLALFGLGQDILSVFFPVFPFFFGLALFIISLKKSD